VYRLEWFARCFNPKAKTKQEKQGRGTSRIAGLTPTETPDPFEPPGLCFASQKGPAIP
jgi:hypothetical protein